MSFSLSVLGSVPDSIWLSVFHFLDAFDLVSLKETNVPQFRRVAEDKSLWRNVSIQERQQLTKADFRKLIPHLGKHTTSINVRRAKIRGLSSKAKKDKYFSTAFLQSVVSLGIIKP